MKIKLSEPHPDVLAYLNALLPLHRHPEERLTPSECRWCIHEWHGSACMPAWANDGCRCESSLTSRDDSWRPQNFGGFALQLHAFMDHTGLDGWAARSQIRRGVR